MLKKQSDEKIVQKSKRENHRLSSRNAADFLI